MVHTNHDVADGFVGSLFWNIWELGREENGWRCPPMGRTVAQWWNICFTYRRSQVQSLAALPGGTTNGLRFKPLANPEIYRPQQKAVSYTDKEYPGADHFVGAEYFRFQVPGVGLAIWLPPLTNRRNSWVGLTRSWSLLGMMVGDIKLGNLMEKGPQFSAVHAESSRFNLQLKMLSELGANSNWDPGESPAVRIGSFVLGGSTD